MNGDGVVISAGIDDDLPEAIIRCFLISSASAAIGDFDDVISITTCDIDAAFDRVAAIDSDRIIAISAVAISGKTTRFGLKGICICL